MILILLHVRDPGFHGRAAEQRSEASGNDGVVFPRQEGRVWLPALAPGPAGPRARARPLSTARRSSPPRRPLNAAPGSAFSRRRAAAARAESEVGTGQAPSWLPAGAERSHAIIFNRGAAPAACGVARRCG